MIPRSPSDVTSRLAVDTKALGELKQSARENSPDALKSAATQFEAMFINEMMKSMRAATPQEGMLENEQTRMFTGMLDQQMSQKMAARGVGLGDMLVRQLSAQQLSAKALALDGGSGSGLQSAGLEGYVKAPAPGFDGRSADEMLRTPGAMLDKLHFAGGAEGASASGRGSRAPHVRAFQDKLAVHAEAAEKATGIPAKFMLGQAALESGWGKRQIRNADGSTTHNLFGIKAGPGWKGKVATAVTTEYVNGVPRAKVEKFRAYSSYEEAFKDYAKLLSNNPRYEKVVANAKDPASFAQGLQRAGYATDPFYASKLTRIIKQSLA
jgi:flagellar protein FlgJ